MHFLNELSAPGLTVWSARGAGTAAQAAGEYVGVLLSGAVRALRNGLYSAGRIIEDEPIAVIAAVGAVLLLMRLARRR